MVPLLLINSIITLNEVEGNNQQLSTIKGNFNKIKND
jgi:hypothetical protein